MSEFWKTKSLDEMTRPEWESLCDGCGRCCLMKFVDDDGVFFTDVGCRLLDLKTGGCSDYQNRQHVYADCVKLTPAEVRARGDELPPTCAYRLVEEGRDLYWWHPLVSHDPGSVRASGMSIVGRTKYREQDFVNERDIEARERKWPQETRTRPIPAK